MDRNQITVNVCGLAGTGKTAIMNIIRAALLDAGIKCNAVDIDGTLNVTDDVQRMREGRLIERGTHVCINEVQLMRRSADAPAQYVSNYA